VRIVELSDHPGDLLTAAARSRDAPRSAHEKKLAALRTQRDSARAQRKWLTYLRLALAIFRHKRDRPQPITVPTDAEEILKAGIAGERLVSRQLAEALDDEWTLLHGYRNGRGEIDYLLLGPKGVFAIEVKNINATVSITRDSWVADKYDRYGHHVDQYPITDRRGRSPSQQLNQPADELAAFLHRRGQVFPVTRVVVLTHDRSRLGRLKDPSVNVAVATRDVLRLIGTEPDILARTRRRRIQTLVEQDHHFHEARRAGKGAT
jgi:hypothetical protein